MNERTAPQRLRAGLDEQPLRTTSPAIFLALLVIYLLTATFGPRQIVDSAMVAYSAWTVAETGDLDLAGHLDDELSHPVVQTQTVEIGERLYTNRFPGAVLIGIPFYAAFSTLGLDTSGPTLLPAGVAAATVTAFSMAVLHAVFRRLTSPTIATVAALVMGLSTATWSVSANALWTHGPAQLWLSLGMLAIASGGHARAGLSHAFAILTRPHLAIVPAISGIHLSYAGRRFSPAFRIGLLALAGLGAWILYGRLLFGTWTLLGGYAQGQLGDRIVGQTPLRFLINVFWMVFHPVRGFLPYSPFLIGLIPGLRGAWNKAPTWVRSSAYSALGYLLVQAWINRWSGGDTYWSYRYALESLTLAAPLLVLAYEQLPPQRRRIVIVLCGAAAMLQIPGALFEALV